MAFFCAVGIGAHALDELHGRPLGHAPGGPDPNRRWRRPGSPARSAIGIAGAIMVSRWIAILVVAGIGFVLAYNLELAGGRFHADLWFALAWGGFPALVGYVVNAGELAWPAVFVAAGCVAVSAAQRALSTPVRRLRRRTTSLEGVQRLGDGTEIELSVAAVAAPLDRALVALSGGVVLLAIGLVAARW